MVYIKNGEIVNEVPAYANTRRRSTQRFGSIDILNSKEPSQQYYERQSDRSSRSSASYTSKKIQDPLKPLAKALGIDGQALKFEPVLGEKEVPYIHLLMIGLAFFLLGWRVGAAVMIGYTIYLTNKHTDSDAADE